MTRTSVAAAVAALFLVSASTLHAQTAGTAGTSANSANPSASARAGAGSASAAATSKGTDTRAASASTQLDRADRKFLENAALDGLKEVETGRAVASKAQDPAVKAFADRMVKDHGDANKKLMDLAQTKGIAAPSDLRKSDRSEIDKMARMDAAKLERAYMKDQVKDHKKDVKEFEREAKNAKDADVKKFASDTLPTLQEHLQMAQDTEGKLNGGGSVATRKAAGTGNAGADTGKK